MLKVSIEGYLHVNTINLPRSPDEMIFKHRPQQEHHDFNNRVQTVKTPEEEVLAPGKPSTSGTQPGNQARHFESTWELKDK